MLVRIVAKPEDSRDYGSIYNLLNTTGFHVGHQYGDSRMPPVYLSEDVLYCYFNTPGIWIGISARFSSPFWVLMPIIITKAGIFYLIGLLLI